MEIAAEKEESGEQLDNEIARRDGLMASAAFSAKQQPADYGKIVVERNGISATRAGGTRSYDGAAQRQPVDTHVQEAAKAQPVSEDRDC